MGDLWFASCLMFCLLMRTYDCRTPSLSPSSSGRQPHGLKFNLTSVEIFSRTAKEDVIISGGMSVSQRIPLMPFMPAGQSGPFTPHPETPISSQRLSHLLSPSPTPALSPSTSPSPSPPPSTLMAPMIFERKLNAYLFPLPPNTR